MEQVGVYRDMPSMVGKIVNFLRSLVHRCFSTIFLPHTLVRCRRMNMSICLHALLVHRRVFVSVPTPLYICAVAAQRQPIIYALSGTDPNTNTITHIYVVGSTTSGTSASPPANARCSCTRGARMWVVPYRMCSATCRHAENMRSPQIQA